MWALTYALLALFHHGGSIAPNWSLGLACGAGGLMGGYIGARLQPRVADRALRLLLAVVAIALPALYIAQSAPSSLSNGRAGLAGWRVRSRKQLDKCWHRPHAAR